MNQDSASLVSLSDRQIDPNELIHGVSVPIADDQTRTRDPLRLMFAQRPTIASLCGDGIVIEWEWRSTENWSLQ